MVDDWYEGMNNKCMSAVLCLDLSECFDTISHDILLHKLETLYGFYDKKLLWIKSYLMNRSQCVRVNGSCSEFENVSIGIPQGSILGPFLFLLFINDLPSSTNNCSIGLFADDITLYTSGKDIDQLSLVLQEELNCVLDWFSANRLFVNPSKSNSILSGSKQLLNSRSLSIKINNIQLEQVSSIKLLGVYIDNNLTWSSQVQYLVNKLSSKVVVMCRLSKILFKELLNIVYLTVAVFD